ncbi:MAG: hypothetical protein IJH64_04755 [Oscillospiraceae bacterium]|nr:hypothetical protein [Oscillospiraceae bacterium]
MEYVFGSRERGGTTQDILRTKGKGHTDLSGSIEVVREYADAKIHDFCKVVSKYLTMQDEEGNCYDWYIVREHYRYEDKFTPGIGKYEQELTDTEINQIEQEQVITDHDIAIMELQDALNV